MELNELIKLVEENERIQAVAYVCLHSRTRDEKDSETAQKLQHIHEFAVNTGVILIQNFIDQDTSLDAWRTLERTASLESIDVVLSYGDFHHAYTEEFLSRVLDVKKWETYVESAKPEELEKILVTRVPSYISRSYRE